MFRTTHCPIAFCNRLSRSECVRSDGCFSPSTEANTVLAPHGSGLTHILTLKEGEQSESEKWPWSRGSMLSYYARLEGIEGDRNMSRSLGLLIALASPAKLRQVHSPRQAQRFKHPAVLGCQHPCAAASLLPGFRDEPACHSSLLVRWIKLQNECRRFLRFTFL